MNQLAEAMDYFAACEALFVSNEVLFHPDIRKRLRAEINEIFSGQDIIRGGVQSHEDEDVPLCTYTDDLKRKIAFAGNLMEGVDEQMRRLSTHNI